MSEAHDLREVDELIASMDTTPANPVNPSTTAPSAKAPRSSPVDPLASPARTPAAPPPTEETDPTKPTPSSTPRLTPRRSDRSDSSGNSSSGQGLPIIQGNNEPPAATTKASATSPTSSPQVSTVAVNVNSTPPSPTTTNEPLGDLDALAELLRSDSQKLSTQTEQRDSISDRASHTEAIDKASALPPLLSSSHKSLSFASHTHSHSAGGRRSTMLQKQASLSLLGQSTQSTQGTEGASELSPRVLYSPRSTTMLNKQNISPSRRRLTIGTHEISPHALERLGVNTDILKKEKGMKKLGISDLDIERFEEIRRYSGVPHSLQPVTKVEFMFGFRREQLQRVKAINRLGTSEEEVQDEFSRRVSRLGVHDVPIAQN